MTEALSLKDFQDLLPDEFSDHAAIAVGVSGGPDSMALAKLLSLWSEEIDGPDIYTLIVDHGLRDGSDVEAASVQERLAAWPKVKTEILRWTGEKSESRVQEAARGARYALMAAFCAEQSISHLYLAHHMDDQAETFLFRLAKGSGLDGLCAMRRAHEYSDDLTLIRPFLSVSKDTLIATCSTHDVGYVRDPSNDSDAFARVRLRKSMAVLAEEGLTVKRLSVTARRLSRAQEALEDLSEKAFDQIFLEKDTVRIVLNYTMFLEQLDEIAFRIVLKAMRQMNPDDDYLPRMEKIEDLLGALKTENPFRKRTLGGLIFERKSTDDLLIITKEK